MKQLHQLAQKWLGDLGAPYPAASPEAVKRLFNELGAEATDDVVSLYEAIGGMDVMDEHDFRLWPLSEIRAENTVQDAAKGVLFGDYLIACWCYRLRPVNASTSAVYVDYFDGRLPILVAESLEVFAQACLERPNDVLHHPPQ